ncbi:MAG TPA: recombinase family protein [Casimicrobiaceae bacterium]|nr:recombinase family protein [Casimicrobiaceae bacterium]
MAAKTGIKRVAIYARVSTDKQTCDNQLRELREVVEHKGWEVAGEYVDRGVSGAKGRDQRPQFDRLLKAATRGQLDVIAAWSTDRLGRSLHDLVGFLEEIRSHGVDLYLHQQAIDTTGPYGKLIFHISGTFAEFERELIKQRVQAGVDRARAQGKRLGRPVIHGDDKAAAVMALRKRGMGLNKIGRELGIGTSTVQRIVQQHAEG